MRQVPSTGGLDAEVRKVVDPLKEIVEIITGNRGNKIEQLPANTSLSQVAQKVNELLALMQESAAPAATQVGVVNLTAAATVDLSPAISSGFAHIAGATGISRFILAQGANVTITFDGAPVLTNSANLILPGGANITAAAGDTAVFVGEAGGVVRCTSYVPAAGYATPAYVQAGDAAVLVTADTRYSSKAMSVRQTVQQGVTNASGYANMLSAGTGLALNLTATAKAMRIAFAAGSTDYVATLSADVSSVVSSLPAYNLSYITADYVSATSATWGKTLAPVQYGYAYNRASQALLHFDGTAGATTMLDDYGNTWTAQGGAKLQTNWTKFGTAALGGGGVNNVLNGTTDWIKTTDITSLGNGRWAMRAWIYPTAFPGSGVYVGLFGAASASNVGVLVGIQNNAGVSKLVMSLSSNGTTLDIASGALANTALSLNTAYFVEVMFDPLLGKYCIYLNGVVDCVVNSTANICAVTTMFIGSNNGANFFTGYIDEFEFVPYCDHPNGTTYSVPTQASSVATAGYSSDFFSIPDMTMYKVTGASASAGANPTLTPVNRVYVGETVTGASAVSSVVNYALNGRYESLNTLTFSTPLSYSHAIGVKPRQYTFRFVNITAEQGYVLGDSFDVTTNVPLGAPTSTSWVNSASMGIYFNSGLGVTPKGGGSAVTFTAAKWKVEASAFRGF